jgi:vacuolar-type H+-ATPase subunit H
METSDGKMKEISGHKFRIVKNGLDESEVFNFISGLLEHNKHLSDKMEHMDSLTKLAERTVIEANKQAESTKKETLEKANSEAGKIIAVSEGKAKAEANNIIAAARQEAERKSQETLTAAQQQAQGILKEASGKAEVIKSSAEQQANRITSEAKLNASAIQEQAQTVLKTAEGKAAATKSDAENEATQILSDAREKAEELLKARAVSAEKEAQSILKEARGKAEQESLLIKRKAEQVLKKSRKISENEIKEKLKKVYQGLLSNLEGIEETTILPEMEEVKDSEPSQIEFEAFVHAESETVIEVPQERPAPRRKESKPSESDTLYEGNVELIVPPPLGLDKMLQLHKHLRNIPNAKVLNLGVASDKSITVRILLESPTPLLSVLEDLPEVESAADDQHAVEATKSGGKTPVKRIIVTTRK